MIVYTGIRNYFSMSLPPQKRIKDEKSQNFTLLYISSKPFFGNVKILHANLNSADVNLNYTGLEIPSLHGDGII